MSAIAETVLPVDGTAIDLRYACTETLPGHDYQDGELVERPRWRVHCVRVNEGEPVELWAIVTPTEPPPFVLGDRVAATGLRARYWTARTICGWTMHADAVRQHQDGGGS